jgi:hypothetical protein
VDNDQPADVPTEKLEFGEIMPIKDCFDTCPGETCVDFFVCYEHWGHPPCSKCGSDMIESKAIIPSVSGLPDFSNGEAVTMSADGGAVLVCCLKCLECGFSRTI